MIITQYYIHHDEFDSQIFKIRNRICELVDVKVSFSKLELDESDKMNCIILFEYCSLLLLAFWDLILKIWIFDCKRWNFVPVTEVFLL